MSERRLVLVQFTRPKKWFQPISWAIRKFQKTEYSHVRISWMAMKTVPVVYEASGSSLKFIGPMAAKDNPVHIAHQYNINLSIEQYRELVRTCMTYANIEYGKKQLVGMGITRIFGLKKNPLADGKKSQVCSEVVGHLLQKILGWDIGLDLETAGPKELNDIIKERLG
jgi:hypothetical protein